MKAKFFQLIAAIMAAGVNRHEAEARARFMLARESSPIYFPPRSKRGWAKQRREAAKRRNNLQK